MDIASLLTTDRIAIKPSITSKKRALELLSELLATGVPNVTNTQIFDALISRERLGSTGLGHGVALPHSRLGGVKKAIGSVLKLDQGVDYDAPDNLPVDFMFALVVPQESTDEHLELLSELATLFADERELLQLRSTNHADALLTILSERTSSHAA